MTTEKTPINLALAILRTICDQVPGEQALVFALMDGECAVMDICDDPYLALARLPLALSTEERNVDAIGISSFGWAAPHVDSEYPTNPSDSPTRRRVHLVTVCTAAGTMASAFRFIDTGEEIADEDGTATGSLADALQVTAFLVTAR